MLIEKKNMPTRSLEHRTLGLKDFNSATELQRQTLKHKKALDILQLGVDHLNLQTYTVSKTLAKNNIPKI